MSTPHVKPPAGLRPRITVRSLRFQEIHQAVQRWEAAGLDIPEAWTIEQFEIMQDIMNTEPEVPTPIGAVRAPLWVAMDEATPSLVERYEKIIVDRFLE